MAYKLGKYFNNTPKFWIDLQTSSEIDKLSTDKMFISQVNKIPKVKKPTAKAKERAKAKTPKKKSPTSYAKPNKQAAKARSKRKVKKFKTGRQKQR